ncbi:hypothetical protein OS493_009149 [Desmophyllum pertusum]|uniref:Uncharacterized protein n=1 Tax=Desmophyllum pertusum TaxID=174260 RepID=A0A9X0CRY4_9CNID|nr:hypothetical protein OS493_009149 [Desmophyllum pertusum]
MAYRYTFAVLFIFCLVAAVMSMPADRISPKMKRSIECWDIVGAECSEQKPCAVCYKWGINYSCKRCGYHSLT